MNILRKVIRNLDTQGRHTFGHVDVTFENGLNLTPN